MNLYWDLMFYNSDAAEIRSGELVVVVPSYVIEKSWNLKMSMIYL